MKTVTYCFDMDGVLANFNKEPNALKRFKIEKGFFSNLEPIRENLNAVKMLIRQGAKVKVLTASPNKQADKDKLLWLQEFLPMLSKENIIICRLGENKADYVDNIVDSVLFDDYGKNCREWRVAGGQAIKITRHNQILEMVVR